MRNQLSISKNAPGSGSFPWCFFIFKRGICLGHIDILPILLPTMNFYKYQKKCFHIAEIMCPTCPKNYKRVDFISVCFGAHCNLKQGQS